MMECGKNTLSVYQGKGNAEQGEHGEIPLFRHLSLCNNVHV